MLPFFSIMATIVTVCVVLLWGMVATLTAIEGWKGKIFYAPCLSALDRKEESPVPDDHLESSSPVDEQNRQPANS